MLRLFIISLCFPLVFELVSASEVTEEQAFNALRSDLSKLTKTLTRDIRLYHWFYTRNNLSELKPNHSYFKRRFDYLAKRFYTPSDRDEVGVGFYAALDPQVSTEFGDQLIEVQIQKGVKFLDIRSGHRYGFEVTLETKDILSRYCWNEFSQDPNVYEKDGEEYASIFKLSIAANQKCLSLLNKVVQSLDVEFLAYGWWPVGGNFGVCDSEEKAAFLIFGKLQSDPSETENPQVDLSSFKVNGFVKNPRFRMREGSSDWEKYFFVDQFSRLSLVDYSESKARWSMFDSYDPYENRSMLEQLSANRFGCLKDKYPEDKLLPYVKQN